MSVGEFVEEFAVAAGTIAALVACRIELQRDRFVARRMAAAWPSGSPWPPPPTRAEARLFTLALVDAGLLEVPLGLAALKGQNPEHYFAAYSRELPLGLAVRVPRSLYVTCILEIAEALLAGRPYRVCANESCGRLFSIQEGRARYGGHRTDLVRYCSRGCGNAQAQRDLRRRRKDRISRGKA